MTGRINGHQPPGLTHIDVAARDEAPHTNAHAALFESLASQLEGIADTCRVLAQEVARDALELLPEPRLMGVVPTATDERPLLSANDVAKLVGVGPRTVRRWHSAGTMPRAVDLGGVLRWRPEVIDDWLREREGAGR